MTTKPDWHDIKTAQRLLRQQAALRLDRDVAAHERKLTIAIAFLGAAAAVALVAILNTGMAVLP